MELAKKIVIDGSSVLRKHYHTSKKATLRFLVIINDKDCYLPDALFRCLAKLAYAKLHNEDGWVSIRDIEPGVGRQYLLKLRIEVKRIGVMLVVLPGLWYGKPNHYRLEADEVIVKDLSEHPDFQVRELV